MFFKFVVIDIFEFDCLEVCFVWSVCLNLVIIKVRKVEDVGDGWFGEGCGLEILVKVMMLI